MTRRRNRGEPTMLTIRFWRSRNERGEKSKFLSSNRRSLCIYLTPGGDVSRGWSSGIASGWPGASRPGKGQLSTRCQSPLLVFPPPWSRWGSARYHWTPARARCGNTLALRDRKQSVVPGRSTGDAGDTRFMRSLVAVTRGPLHEVSPLSLSLFSDL